MQDDDGEDEGLRLSDTGSANSDGLLPRQQLPIHADEVSHLHGDESLHKPMSGSHKPPASPTAASRSMQKMSSTITTWDADAVLKGAGGRLDRNSGSFTGVARGSAGEGQGGPFVRPM